MWYTRANPPVNTVLSNVFVSVTTVSWSANNNPTDTTYILVRSSSADFSQSVVTVTLTALSYTDTGLSGNTTHYYKVRARNGEGGLTAFAETVSTRTLSSSIEGLVATGQDRKVVLDWQDSKGPDIAGYFVHRSSSAAGSFERLNSAALQVSIYEDTGLKNGVTLYYAVTTIDNSSVESPFSNIVSARPRKSVGPREPLGVSGSLSSQGLFTLQWSPVTVDVAGSTRVELAGYRIYKSSALEGPFELRDLVPPTTTVWTAPEPVPPAVWYMVRSLDISENESADSVRIQTVAEPILVIAPADETVHILFN